MLGKTRKGGHPSCHLNLGGRNRLNPLAMIGNQDTAARRMFRFRSPLWQGGDFMKESQPTVAPNRLGKADKFVSDLIERGFPPGGGRLHDRVRVET